ncbi:MAG: peptide chain release factor N(5)-glutamine methyltransferase [Odoribacter sp.]|nr:peptide chain release factor N(5)-glutamine methyltransferase [Odoribacter sp.]
MTLSDLNRDIIKRLTPALGNREARATARLLLDDDLGVTPTTLLTCGDRVLEPETISRFDSYIRQIIDGNPAQYVVGQAQFMGIDLKVSPAVLIPRPETAALVDMITDEFNGHHDLRIIDIGTGSGCIAIALARALPYARITATDISRQALEIASENALNNATEITFIHNDILTPDTGDIGQGYDIIVSNPPYIADSERKCMDRRVYGHEPSSALFVPDSDPLRFYRAIAARGTSILKPGGRLFFEINPLFTARLKTLLESQSYTSIDITRDYLGNYRYCSATLPS